MVDAGTAKKASEFDACQKLMFEQEILLQAPLALYK